MLVFGDETEDQRILSLVLSTIKSQFVDKVDYQVKYENLVRELELKFRIRELEFDNRIRELEQNIRIRELKQDDRIRKLEHSLQIQSKQTEDIQKDCIKSYSKKDNTDVRVNDDMVLANTNATVSKTPDTIDMETVPNELKHVHKISYGKNENLARMLDRKRRILSIH
ncbi:GOLGB1 [Mytilus edulis]|uniref:GOLGB1 n=1 Tax=Mytilus edulis TaxID=6550 RepID=A0A8S3VHA8_MYTED|nr:GOLGB1 [Mytilus edulis]